MASVKNTRMNGTDWVDEGIDPADLSATFDAASGVIVGSIYTGNTFDSTQVGSGSNSGNHTIALGSASLTGYVYAYINVTFSAQAQGAAVSASTVSLRIEKQETGGGGGGWSDVLATSVVLGGVIEGTASTETMQTVKTLSFIVTLSGGELTNGLDVRLTSTSAQDTAAMSNNFVNIQTWFRGSA